MTENRLDIGINTLAKLANRLTDVNIEVDDGIILAMLRAIMRHTTNTGNPISRWFRRRRFHGWNHFEKIMDAFRRARRDPLTSTELPYSVIDETRDKIQDIANTVVGLQNDGTKTPLRNVIRMLKTSGTPFTIDNVLAISEIIANKLSGCTREKK